MSHSTRSVKQSIASSPMMPCSHSLSLPYSQNESPPFILAKSIIGDYARAVHDLVTSPTISISKLQQGITQIQNGKSQNFDICNQISLITSPHEAQKELITKSKRLIHSIPFTSCPDLKSHRKALVISKVMEFQVGYPIAIWCYDTFSRDRIHYLVQQNALSNQSSNHTAYSIDHWFQRNHYGQFTVTTNPQTANHLKKAMESVSKMLLPPLPFNITTTLIQDDLNYIAICGLGTYQFVNLIQNEMRYPLMIELVV